MKSRFSLLVLPMLLIAGACSPAETETPSPTPSSVTHQPSLTATPTPSSSPSETEGSGDTPTAEPSASFPPYEADESADQRGIREGWQNYWAVYDKFIKDPSLTDLTETQIVTAGEESGYILDQIRCGDRTSRQFPRVVSYSVT